MACRVAVVGGQSATFVVLHLAHLSSVQASGRLQTGFSIAESNRGFGLWPFSATKRNIPCDNGSGMLNVYSLCTIASYLFACYMHPGLWASSINIGRFSASFLLFRSCSARYITNDGSGVVAASNAWVINRQIA